MKRTDLPIDPKYSAGGNIIAHCQIHGGHQPEALEAIKALASALQQNALACGVLAKSLEVPPAMVVNGGGAS